MKKQIKYNIRDKRISKEITYIPIRYIFAVLLSIFEILAIISIVVAMCYYIRWFYILAVITHFACIIQVIASDDNPDYKVPWLVFIMLLPVVGFMLYFRFYSRKLKKKYIKRLMEVKQKYAYPADNALTDDQLREELEPRAASTAKVISEISRSSVFRGGRIDYFPSGEQMHARLLEDLRGAEHFIFMEYFIIEEGVFWDSVLDILTEKAGHGVDVRVLYDDIGCMKTLPGNYSKILKKCGIKATPFSVLRGSADGEFNNRDHRKITVIDGRIGYTGGVNIADEYINLRSRYGHWKDTAIRIEGEAVYRLTNLFLNNFGINTRDVPPLPQDAYPQVENRCDNGYLVPFGDGPAPIFERNVGKTVIQNMLYSAERYIYMTTPYLIIDNDLCTDIENTAMRGVDVRIVVPHIPDKRLVFTMTKSYYHRLMSAGVKIYEYEPGFIHAKSYVCDDKYAMIGTINLDYRSLVHHFENGVWMYGCDCIGDMKADIDDTIARSIHVTGDMLKTGRLVRLIRSIVKIFAPML